MRLRKDKEGAYVYSKGNSAKSANVLVCREVSTMLRFVAVLIDSRLKVKDFNVESSILNLSLGDLPIHLSAHGRNQPQTVSPNHFL